MIEWIIVFAILAVVFAVLGFGNLAKGFASIAKILFYIFIVVLIAAIIANFM